MKAPNVLMAVLCAAAASIASWPTTEALAQSKPALTRDIDGIVRGTLYSAMAYSTYEDATRAVTYSFNLNIPAGKLFVVQQVDIVTTLSDGQVPIVQAIAVNTGSGFNTVGFASTGSSGLESGGVTWFTAVRPISLVLAPAHQLRIFVQRSNILGGSTGNFSQAVVLGHLIDAP